jgi:hypothetical protein
VHRFVVEILLDDGSWIQDCACEYRQRVRKNVQGDVIEVFTDGIVPGGSSVNNFIFGRREDGSFTDRWSMGL